MPKSKIKEIIIAVLIGASINFLAKIIDFLLEVQSINVTQIIASGGGMLTYLFRNIKS